MPMTIRSINRLGLTICTVAPMLAISSCSTVSTGASMLLGATMDGLRASSLLKNLRTLHIRMKQHSANAMYLADQFEQLGLKTVYPGLKSHPSHEIFKTMMNKSYGFGGMLTIDIGSLEKANELMELMQHKKQQKKDLKEKFKRKFR